MASVFNRGTRDTPEWVAVYEAGKRPDGKIIWRQKRVPTEHNTTKTTAKAWAADYERGHKAGKVAAALVPPSSELCGVLFDRWEKTFAHRSAQGDKSRLKNHLRPAFACRRVDGIAVPDLMCWIDDQRASADRLSEASIRHNLNLMSRFYSWCIERGHATSNPVRSVTPSSRPKMAPKKDVPYLNDDRKVRAIFNALPEPINLMFYIGHTSGLRLGEICGLRVSDVALFLDRGLIRASHSYDGPLKEDKKSEGKSKVVPAAADAEATIRPWLNRRLAEDAAADDYLFPILRRTPGQTEVRVGHYRPEHVEKTWARTLLKLGFTKPASALQRRGRKVEVDPETGEPEPLPFLSFYEATRHSFASRLLEAGNSLDEVSAALNHSSPEVTKRHYAHWVRENYAPTMRIGIGMTTPTDEGGQVVRLPTKPHAHSARHSARVDSGAAGDQKVGKVTDGEAWCAVQDSNLWPMAPEGK